MSFEDIVNFQFYKNSSIVSDKELTSINEVINQYSTVLKIKPKVKNRKETELRINKEIEYLRSKYKLGFGVNENISDLVSNKMEIQKIYEEYLLSFNLNYIDEKISRMIVSNPYSGELLKHLAVELADIGLIEYYGKVLKPLPSIPSKECLSSYIIKRLSFVRYLFIENSINKVPLYRGMSSSSKWTIFPKSFSSWTLDYSVASDLAQLQKSNNSMEIAYIFKRLTHIDEVFMTCIETKAMNAKYDEKEVLLFNNPQKGVF
jgi:hypothetical protein